MKKKLKKVIVMVLFFCIILFTPLLSADVTVHGTTSWDFPTTDEIFINQDNNETLTFQYGKYKIEKMLTNEEKEMLDKLTDTAKDEYMLLKAEYYKLASVIRQVYPRATSCYRRAALMEYYLNNFLEEKGITSFNVERMQLQCEPDNSMAIHLLCLLVPNENAYDEGYAKENNYGFLKQGGKQSYTFDDAVVLDPSQGLDYASCVGTYLNTRPWATDPTKGKVGTDTQVFGFKEWWNGLRRLWTSTDQALATLECTVENTMPDITGNTFRLDMAQDKALAGRVQMLDEIQISEFDNKSLSDILVGGLGRLLPDGEIQTWMDSTGDIVIDNTSGATKPVADFTPELSVAAAVKYQIVEKILAASKMYGEGAYISIPGLPPNY